MMAHYISQLTPLEWAGIGVIFLILDFFIATSGFLVWLGILACLVGLLLWLFPSLPWPHQLLIFSLSGIVCSVTWWAYLLRHSSHLKVKKQLASKYIGETFELAAPIVGGKGTLQLDGCTWEIKGPNLPIHAKVRVIAVDKAVLQVEEASE